MSSSEKLNFVICQPTNNDSLKVFSFSFPIKSSKHVITVDLRKYNIMGPERISFSFQLGSERLIQRFVQHLSRQVNCSQLDFPLNQIMTRSPIIYWEKKGRKGKIKKTIIFPCLVSAYENFFLHFPRFILNNFLFCSFLFHTFQTDPCKNCGDFVQGK